MLTIALIVLSTACAGSEETRKSDAPEETKQTETGDAAAGEDHNPDNNEEESGKGKMKLKINGESVNVKWEDNDSVRALAELAEKGLCHMPNLEGTTPVTIGGIVSTSGVGGVYPANLVIGTITEIDDATVDISAAAIIEPAADLKTVTGVFVITEFEGQGMQ